jgi:hypothetical protein
MQPYREMSLGRNNAPKLSFKWYGPIRIQKKMGNVSYQIQLSEDAKIHGIFHVNQLKKHIGPNAIPNPTLPLVTAEGKVKLYPIEILERHQVPRSFGQYDVSIPQWLIHWDSIERTFPDFKP